MNVLNMQFQAILSIAAVWTVRTAELFGVATCVFMSWQTFCMLVQFTTIQTKETSFYVASWKETIVITTYRRNESNILLHHKQWNENKTKRPCFTQHYIFNTMFTVLFILCLDECDGRLEDAFSGYCCVWTVCRK